MKISVAMTTYNGASFVREQLDSIFTQRRPPDELIICDDQSTDETPKLLGEYAARAPVPTTVVSNESRLGSTKNFEQAIRLCSGDVIALSDQDDIWYPHKLEVIEQRFDHDPDLGLVSSNGDLIDERGRPLAGDMWDAFWFSRRMRERLNEGPAYDLLLSWPFVTGATAAFRSEFKCLVLPMPAETPTFVHDRWMTAIIGAVARIGIIEDRLIAYRLHSSQQIGVGTPVLSRLVTPCRTSSDQIALSAMRDRLAGNPSAKAEFLRALDTRQRHVEVRTALPRNPVTRLKGVALEYASGRYSRYPMPFAHALRDLIAGTI